MQVSGGYAQEGETENALVRSRDQDSKEESG